MTASKDAIRGSLVVLDAVEAAQSTRAFLIFLGSAIASLIVGGIFAGIAATLASNGVVMVGGLFGFIGALAAMLIVATGVSAAGKTLMDRIQGRPELGLVEVLLAGLTTLPKLISVMLIEIAVYIVFLIVLSIVLFICKIPVLGPLLYVVVYPVAAVIAGIMWFTFVFIVNPLAAPAFWEGYNISGALGVLGANRNAFSIGRLLPPIVQQFVLMFVVGLVTFITSSILFGGSAFVAMMAKGILGLGGGGLRDIYMGAMLGDVGGAMQSFGGGYMLPTAIGVGILAAVAFTFPLLVYLAGICTIFLDFADVRTTTSPPPLSGTSTVATPPFMPTAPAASAAPAPVAMHPICPACGTPAEADDAFCGECGHDLPRSV